MTFTFKAANLPSDHHIFSYLVVEDEEGHYEPVAMASTLPEASELADYDFRRRLRQLESDEDPGLCPYEYVLWARGISGLFERVASALVCDPAAPADPATTSEQDGAKQ